MAVMMVPALPELPNPTPYDQSLIDGFELSLRGRRLSDNTINGSYLPAATLLARWASGTGKPTLDNLTRGDLDAWLV
jgi:hypothetical protein